jgi:glutaconyl-CoA/methylmalonyl-CoA decarboxylase subunit gamma
MKKLRVTVEGKVYEVLVEVLDEGAPSAHPPIAAANNGSPVSTPAPAPVAPVAPRSSPTAGAGDVTSPLAGKVVSIDVKTGDTVAEGAQLVTVEAMKMNTYVFAPISGRIGAILVNAGDGVEEGAVILRIA